MFISTAAAMIFTQFSGYAAVFADGVITSRVLGHEAYSAISLFSHFINVIIITLVSISVASQVVSSQAVGRGEKDKANSVFTVAVFVNSLAALFFVVISVFRPSDIFRIVCGITRTTPSPEIYSQMLEYIRGFVFGIPFFMMTHVVVPAVVIDGGKSLVGWSSLVLMVTDIAGDFLNAYALGGGVYGMGLATSLSYILQFAVIMLHFVRKSSYFTLSLKGFEAGQIPEMVKAASPIFIKKAAETLRGIFLSRMNLYVALTTAAIAAQSIQNDMFNLLFCISMGAGKTLLSMSAMFFGAEDRRGLTQLFRFAMKFSLAVSGAIGLLSFIGADVIAGFFTKEPEVRELAVFSIRFMALGVVLDIPSLLFSCYLQGINERILVNVINVAGLFVPALTAFVMGMSFGSRGVMASVAVGKLLLIILLAVMIFLRTGSLKNFTLLPENFGGSDEDNVYTSITSELDVIVESRLAERFCIEHGIGARESKLAALFIEETASNIIAHGKAKGRREASADYRISVSGGKISITLRDCCEYFDPSAFYEAHKDDSPENISGMRIVMRLADDVRYFSAFNSNNIMICIDTEKGK
ncbi:MAG: ATP-binding protein [Synergistaceae bacterium]|nr:ATP-binding protein [Synergistaceae bacterium]